MQLSSQTLFSTNMPLEKDQSPTDYCPKARNAKNINSATFYNAFYSKREWYRKSTCWVYMHFKYQKAMILLIGILLLFS